MHWPSQVGLARRTGESIGLAQHKLATTPRPCDEPDSRGVLRPPSHVLDMLGTQAIRLIQKDACMPHIHATGAVTDLADRAALGVVLIAEEVAGLDRHVPACRHVDHVQRHGRNGIAWQRVLVAPKLRSRLYTRPPSL
jgi:hypothetical protein